MTSRMLDLIRLLSEIPGPVGREELVQNAVREELEKFGLEVEQDRIGNLSATLEGTENHFALVAHADEVGFLVSSIQDSGFLDVKWNTRGHLPDLRLIPGQRVKVLVKDKSVPGCFCLKTAHIAGPEGKNKIPSKEEVFLDIGATTAEEVKEMGVNIGSPVVYDAQLQKQGHNLVGKSMDDRVGLTMMLMIAERLAKLSKDKRPTVTFVSTVMEELGAKGAAVVAKKLDVDGAIILEIGLADDHPGTSGEANVGLGKGPVVVIKDSEVHYSHSQNEALLSIAEENNITVQRAVYHHYATDGLQFISQGQIVSVIGVPCRYSHSSFETVRPKDIIDSVELVSLFFQRK
ncbi:MAG: M42 family metallopeptidase [Candidatus Hodarchaeota archaeon]